MSLPPYTFEDWKSGTIEEDYKNGEIPEIDFEIPLGLLPNLLRSVSKDHKYLNDCIEVKRESEQGDFDNKGLVAELRDEINNYDPSYSVYSKKRLKIELEKVKDKDYKSDFKTIYLSEETFQKIQEIQEKVFWEKVEWDVEFEVNSLKNSIEDESPGKRKEIIEEYISAHQSSYDNSDLKKKTAYHNGNTSPYGFDSETCNKVLNGEQVVIENNKLLEIYVVKKCISRFKSLSKEKPRNTYDNETKKRMIQEGRKKAPIKIDIYEEAYKIISESNHQLSYFITEKGNASTNLYNPIFTRTEYSIGKVRYHLNKAINKGINPNLPGINKKLVDGVLLDLLLDVGFKKTDVSH